MATVLVERSFEQPVDLAEFSRLAKRFGWCLEANGVKPSGLSAHPASSANRHHDNR